MKRIVILVILSVLFLAIVGSASGTHEPIIILGNADFTEENGVVSGSGTAEDPYTIAGWEIDVPDTGSYGVKIENASAHFVLRGLIIRGAMNPRGAAIRLGFVSAATVENCSIVNSQNGIEISSSTAVVLSGNAIYVMGHGLNVIGESAAEYDHLIDESNVLNDYPIRYLYGKDGETVSGIRSSNLYIVASRHMTITNNEIVNGDGIQLAFVDDSLISGNEVYRTTPIPTDHGISLYRSNGNTVKENLLKNNRYAGLYLWLSSKNEIVGNQFLANNYGLILAGSDDNRVTENIVYANPTGIAINAGSVGNEIVGNTITHENAKYGISIEQAMENRVEANVIIEAETGILLGVQANSNKILSNTIVKAAYGMSITGSNNEVAGNLISQSTRGILFPETYGKQIARGNSFHDNLFANNGRHLYLNHDSEATRVYRNAFLGGGSTLIEDYGKTTWTIADEGNYWSNYQGEDTDGDGIGDDPVMLYPAGVEDTAPLLSLETARNGLGALNGLEERNLTVMTESGASLSIPALIADEGHERFVGFRGYPAELIEDSPGILFAYEDEAERRFTMKTVPFPLDIAFFDGSGAFVGSTTMEADSDDLYTAKGPFQYALELPSGTLAELGIGTGSHLVFP